MRAFLAVCEKTLFGRANQERIIVLFRICEFDRAANRHVGQIRDLAHRRIAAPLAACVFKNDPELSDEEGEAREHEKFREVAPRDELVLRPVDREVVPPLRLLVIRAAVGRNAELVGVLYSHKFSMTSAGVTSGYRMMRALPPSTT